MEETAKETDCCENKEVTDVGNGPRDNNNEDDSDNDSHEYIETMSKPEEVTSCQVNEQQDPIASSVALSLVDVLESEEIKNLKDDVRKTRELLDDVVKNMATKVKPKKKASKTVTKKNAKDKHEQKGKGKSTKSKSKKTKKESKSEKSDDETQPTYYGRDVTPVYHHYTENEDRTDMRFVPKRTSHSRPLPFAYNVPTRNVHSRPLFR